jgi:hypothetical protein
VYILHLEISEFHSCNVWAELTVAADWRKLEVPQDRAQQPASFPLPLPEANPRVQRRSAYGPWSARLWALSFACWSVVAILDVAGSKAYAVAAGYRPPGFLLLLTWALTYAYGMALLTPAICCLSERYPFTRQHWGNAALVQLPASILTATVAAVLSASLNFLLPWSRPFLDGGFRAHTMGLLLGNLPRYFLIVAISQAFFYYERFRERELRGVQLEGQLAIDPVDRIGWELCNGAFGY